MNELNQAKRAKLIKQAHKLLDRIESNLKYIVDSIKAKKEHQKAA